MDLRAGVLWVTWDLWPLVLWGSIFAAMMAGAYAARDQERAPPNAAAWSAVPLGVAATGILTALIMVLCVPAEMHAETTVRAYRGLLRAATAPVSLSLQVAAALAATAAGASWWRGRRVAPREAAHAALCSGALALSLGLLGRYAELGRALLAWAGVQNAHSAARFLELQADVTVLGWVTAVAIAVCTVVVAGAWVWMPALRRSGRLVAATTAAVALLGLALQLAVVARANSLPW